MTMMPNKSEPYQLIVRLSGPPQHAPADYELVRAPLGVVAATPLLNTAAPVNHSFNCIYESLADVF
jgi:hypothetical protein